MRLRRRHAATLAALCLGSALALAAEPPPGDPTVVETLSGIDYVPTKSSLDDVFDGAAAADLITIASDDSDPGVRLRAYRALALYPGAETAAALRDALDTYAADESGIGTMLTRAAALSLARVDGEAAVPDLDDLLQHPSRDVRATIAQALALTGSPDAVSTLRDRLPVEPVEQVRLAIAEALRELAP
jgi:HEAT repeat protein